MDTKAKILKTAMELYNSKGVHAITSRHIAAEMGISAGNLHYHFKQTDEIIRALYDQLSSEFDNIMNSLESLEQFDVNVFNAVTTRSFELTYKYRFIFLHFVEIGMRIPSIRRDYNKLTKRRTLEFIGFFKQLQSQKLFRDDLPQAVWEALVTQIFIVSDFWLSNNEITLKLKGSKAVEHYSKVFSQMLYPYFNTSLNYPGL